MSPSRRSLVLGALVLGLGGCADDLALSSTEQGITVSPGSWDFGATPVGTEVGPRSITVSYGTGYGSDVVNAISSCPDFRVDLGGATLPYEVWRFCDTGQFVCQFIDIQTMVFNVYFRPSVANVESCNLLIDFGTAPQRIVPLTGTGTAPPIDITLVQPSNGVLDFGDVLVGQASTPRTVTVRSDGGSALQITGASASGAGFSHTGPATVTLPPSATADYSVVCTPPAMGLTTGSFRITSNDPDEPNTDVALRCNGIQSALAIDPSPATLPQTRVGETTEVPITLTNSGSAGLAIESTSITGNGLAITAEPASLTLAPLAQTTMTVAFTPAADGDVDGTLTITYDGGQTRQIGITGPGRVAALSVTPGGQVDFGPICVGQSDAELFVALDTGSGAFLVQDVTLTGSGFQLTPLAPATYPASVAPLGGGTVTFQVGVAPAVPGELEGEVAIATDIPGRGPETIALHATALAGGTSATPDELDTGAAVVGTGGGARLISLSNCEIDPLTIVSVAIEGADAADFAIVTAPVLADLAPGSTAAWLVELRPMSPGAKTATFHIVHSRGTANVALIGDGLDASGHAGGDVRGSYYACNATGGPGGLTAIVIALAIALGGRRRRHPVR